MNVSKVGHFDIFKVGNQTSSQDPQAVNSRVFVGNLNTFQIVKTDVEKIFQKYGRIAGISMHKGYAFVQFTSPFDARSACLGEDAKSLCGQTLDVNMVSEPKAHISKVKAQKRQKEKGEALPGGGVLSYYMAAGMVSGVGMLPQGLPTAKRPRVALDEVGSESAESGEGVEGDCPMDEEIDLDSLKSYSCPDVLICGNCRMVFTSIHTMVSHKRHYCKLRFTCKCESEVCPDHDQAPPPYLQCSNCSLGFPDPWDLMEHVQEAHTMNIYQLCGPQEHDDNDNITSGDNQTPANGCCS